MSELMMKSLTDLLRFDCKSFVIDVLPPDFDNLECADQRHRDA
jgi:hypothetical protein